MPMRSPTSSTAPMSAKGCTRIASVAPVEILFSPRSCQRTGREEVGRDGGRDAPGEDGDDDEVHDGGGEGPGVGDDGRHYCGGDEDVQWACGP